MYWLLRPWRHAFDFSGRSPRIEYWLFQLQFYVAVILAALGAAAFDRGTASMGPGGTAFVVVFSVVVLGSFIPNLACAVRRLHDQNKPGIALLLGLIPLIGGFILLFFMVTPGDEDENEYGPNPLDQREMDGVSDVFE
ncbi:DUF805 domain-containing protein [Allosphingosinicella sp.]|uniref:DUF805 domain-containing protein n=1 Tax=Allosphingosinicella sp. TaxID=2823234 RepID=UPI0037844AAA